MPNVLVDLTWQFYFLVCIANIVPLLCFYEITFFEKLIINNLEQDQKRKSVVESPGFSKQRMFQIYYGWFHSLCDIRYVHLINILRITVILIIRITTTFIIIHNENCIRTMCCFGCTCGHYKTYSLFKELCSKFAIYHFLLRFDTVWF